MDDDYSLQQLQAAGFMNKAVEKYPYLKDKGIDFIYTPNAGAGRMLEFWPPDEQGDPSSPRPKELPIGRSGVQAFKSGVSPEDVLGDYVSHYGVTKDPQLAQLYQQFQASVPDSVMRQRYAYHVQNLGEKRPYDQWLKQTGMPEYFRGYTFNQWQDAQKMYSPDQLKILDQVKAYLGIK